MPPRALVFIRAASESGDPGRVDTRRGCSFASWSPCGEPFWLLFSSSKLIQVHNNPAFQREFADFLKVWSKHWQRSSAAWCRGLGVTSSAVTSPAFLGLVQVHVQAAPAWRQAGRP